MAAAGAAMSPLAAVLAGAGSFYFWGSPGIHFHEFMADRLCLSYRYPMVPFPDLRGIFPAGGLRNCGV